MKKRVIKVVTATLAGLSLIGINAACEPPVQAPPKASSIPARPICKEEAGDLTPKVLEFAWAYPVPLTVPQVSCQPAATVTQIDVWISLAKGANVASLLCISIGGLAYSPGGVKPGQVWLTCAGVPRWKLGIPG